MIEKLLHRPVDEDDTIGISDFLDLKKTEDSEKLEMMRSFFRWQIQQEKSIAISNPKQENEN